MVFRRRGSRVGDRLQGTEMPGRECDVLPTHQARLSGPRGSARPRHVTVTSHVTKPEELADVYPR